jgi:thiol-disulfide isomerase/thioredoxin
MRGAICRTAGVLAVALGLAGCAREGDTGAAGGERKKGAKTTAVEVAEVRYDGLETALNEQKGAVVLVDFWATWCGPCVRNFPHLVELHKAHAEQGLTCVSVSLDRAGPVPGSNDQVLAFLKEKGATFPNFVLAAPGSEEEKMAKKFGPFDGIPYMVMFDRSGKRVWTSDDIPEGLTAARRHEHVEKRVRDELAK